MLIPKDRNIAILISNNTEYQFLIKKFNWKVIYKNFHQYNCYSMWIYCKLDNDVIGTDFAHVNPIKNYPNRNYLILDIKILMREEKLNRIYKD